MKRMLSILLLGVFMGSALLLAGCGAGDGAPAGRAAGQENIVEQAAREATAIVAQAQATALVLQAQAQATAVANQLINQNPTPIPAATWMAYVPTTESTPADLATEESEAPEASEQPAGETVEVLSVGFAGEGGFIMIRFLASPDIAERWWQGSVSVQVEPDGTLYNEIPVLPKIGPLIGRPKQDGQIGYVMLVNPPPGLQAGELVTVTLGNYKFEHIPVK